MLCQKCGTKNPDGQVFCSQCGAQLPAAQAAAQPGAQPPDTRQPAAGSPPESRVAGPAIGLMVYGGLLAVLGVISVIGNIFSIGMTSMAGARAQDPMAQYVGGALGIALAAVWIILGAVVLFGAMKMKSLTSYGLAMAAAIIPMVPCIGGHPCCCWPLGLGLGIWGLVVLLNNEVKAAFR